MNNPFVDLALSQRLESAEAYACAQYAAARRRIVPQSDAEWIKIGGATVVYDSIDSPATQTFCVGLLEPLTDETITAIEDFYRRHNAPVQHEVSPFAGVATFDLLCRRNYRPIEISSVLFRAMGGPLLKIKSGIRVRTIQPEEASLWAQISAKGWSHEYPEMNEHLLAFSSVVAAREGSVNFLAELDGIQGAAASISVDQGVALFAGAATIPEMRKHGLQTALLEYRLHYATEHGCDLASIVTLPGSDSQRNAERNGFQIAYTRMKWRLNI